MFRKPRDIAGSDLHVLPSVGRPPSPPSTANNKPQAMAATRTMPPRTSSGQKQARISTTPKGNASVKKPVAGNNSKPKAKPNGSILSFFKKDDGLFVAGTGATAPAKEVQHLDLDVYEDDEAARFNEESGAIKRRKLDSPPEQEAEPPAEQKPPVIKPTSSVPFVEESDSEDEDGVARIPVSTTSRLPVIKDEPVPEVSEPITAPPRPPPLIHQPTSASVADNDGFADYEGADDFEDDVFDQGEEYLERQWMQEQRKLEMEDEGIEDDSFQDQDDDDPTHIKTEEPATLTESPPCPICNISLQRVAESDAAVHVNNCLDGNPTPLPVKVESPPKTVPSPARFKKPVSLPKPGQSQPESASASGSAFSKLMSSKAEDIAWASAAAAENASRGKPSYQRTCPFYKIMPGFNICVDAFRYNAVAGCKAYFLSHFHSDHYIGLTANWSHGPIYCSKVTANLVRQQLRVDAKWVVPLEWETKTEVPGTPGVTVTMISANHCPGSSLFLFEKPLSKGPSPKLQRVLHCGDFRACRAHVQHPLLRPDVLDAVSGKTREQKIDVCYLDTTYLNPKYAFPEQEDVIKACSDMCLSLNKVSPDASDGWETMKRERAGKGMVDFVRRDSNSIKAEEDEETTTDMKVMTNGKLGSSKNRGRLLVVVGTYSIGKERICIGIAKALDSKIFAPPNKMRICRALEDPDLDALLTKDPREAQVHMTPLFEIRADTLDDYLQTYTDSFARCVGFRPSGWNYRPPLSRVETPTVQTVLHSSNWRSSYSMKDLVPQRGSTRRSSCFGVPYSEHSSFRELSMFCCALRIEKVVPTVNVGSAKGRERMKAWCERWAVERKKNGCFDIKGW